jgi:uncharacterized protein YndB with AHSA1/START domain
MSVLENNAANETAGREIVISRMFDAPRELVFDTWTDPAHVGAWWGPEGFTTTTHAIDVRPGGVWRFVMHGPDGTDFDNVVLYREIVRPERLSYQQGVHEPDGFDVTVTFEEAGGGTRLTLRMLFPTAAARNFVVEKYGAIEGGHQTLSRLAEQVAARNVRVRITRLFDAPRELVFRAWTDREQIGRWWGPHHFTNEVRTFDPRAGGAMEIDMIGPDGTVYQGGGTFLEVVEPERLVFRSTALDPDGNIVLEDQTTVTFEAVDGRTRMTLDAQVVHVRGVGLHYIRGMEEGWAQSLERLGVAVDPNTFVIARTFDAPRELVFRAWTEREHLVQWFGPKGFEMFACSVDLRPGGLMHYGLRAANGMEMWGRWEFREIVPPRQLVYVSSFSDPEGAITRAPFLDGRFPLEVFSSVIFEESDGQTTVTIYGVPLNATADERTAFAGMHPSMQQGWGGTFDQLADYLTRSASTEPARQDRSD